MSLSLNITIEQLAEVFNKLSQEEKAALKKLLPSNWFEEDFVLTQTHKNLLDKAEQNHQQNLSASYSWEEVKANAINQQKHE